jgi:hypothetical protein
LKFCWFWAKCFAGEVWKSIEGWRWSSLVISIGTSFDLCLWKFEGFLHDKWERKRNKENLGSASLQVHQPSNCRKQQKAT